MFAGGAGEASGSTPVITCHLGLATPDQVLDDILLEHDVYLKHFVEVFNTLIDSDEELSLEERSYIGLMAACRHKCSVLVSEQRERFQEVGGPPEWLEGLHRAPQRMRCLHQANMVLAHQPWKFNRSHIEDMVKAGLKLTEIVPALTLMAYFHSMAGMLHALGIEASSGEQDLSYQLPPDAGAAALASSSPRSSELSEGGVAVLVARLQTSSGGACGGGAQASGGYTSSSQSTSAASYDAAVASGLPGPSFGLNASQPDESEDSKYSRFTKYSPNINFMYEDFYRRGGRSVAPTLKYQRLWEEIGYSMLAKFTSQELSDAIDNKFRTAFTMTYNTCGDRENVNTAPFRRAIWNYTQSLFGIRRDDYDYGDVNKFLDRHLKVFLKTMSVAPDRLVTSNQSPPAIINDLRTSEQVHIVILAAEARMQVEMVYAMLAVERYYM